MPHVKRTVISEDGCIQWAVPRFRFTFLHVWYLQGLPRTWQNLLLYLLNIYGAPNCYQNKADCHIPTFCSIKKWFWQPPPLYGPRYIRFAINFVLPEYCISSNYTNIPDREIRNFQQIKLLYQSKASHVIRISNRETCGALGLAGRVLGAWL